MPLTIEQYDRLYTEYVSGLNLMPNTFAKAGWQNLFPSFDKIKHAEFYPGMVMLRNGQAFEMQKLKIDPWDIDWNTVGVVRSIKLVFFHRGIEEPMPKFVIQYIPKDEHGT